MQRVATLTDILAEKVLNNAPVQELLITVKMLEAELLHLKSIKPPPTTILQDLASIQVHKTLPAAEPDELIPSVAEPLKTIEVLQIDEAEVQAELDHIKLQANEKNNMSYQNRPAINFDMMDEIPTMVDRQVQNDTNTNKASDETITIHEVKENAILTEKDIAEINEGILALAAVAETLLPKELNETLIHNNHASSINETLATPKLELSDTLMDTPIKDLRKAIGVNERFLYLNELFRGDESMYERSIKTINAFEIYPEAEYWIRRELKLKLGWNDNYQTVKQFDQLIRRRFA